MSTIVIQPDGTPLSVLPVPVLGSDGAGAIRDGAPASGVATVGVLGVRLLGNGDVAAVALVTGVLVAPTAVEVLGTGVFVAGVVVTVLVAVALVWALLSDGVTFIQAATAMQARPPTKRMFLSLMRM